MTALQRTPQLGVSSLDRPQNSTVAIEARGISKCFRIYSQPLDVLLEAIFRKQRHREFWALRDVNFRINHGEIVGLIGVNGAGKSTLLRILAGVLDSTSGEMFVDGRLRAILELGTGFQEERTGRENIFIGGAFLGYSQQELESSFEQIVDFAELRPFIDQPFRTYSSGMKARLTFAVTFFKKPEVMIIDEALSVGDAGFTNKCINRVIELCADGATALVVSHNMYVLERLCNRVLYLKQGSIWADGPPLEVCKQYEQDLLQGFAESQQSLRASEVASAEVASGSTPDAVVLPPEEIEAMLSSPTGDAPAVLHMGLVDLVEVRLLDDNGTPCELFTVGSPFTVEITLNSKIAKDNIDVGIQIYHESGAHAVTSTNRYQLDEQARVRPQSLHLRRGRQTFQVRFPRLFLGAGHYFLNIGISPDGLRHYSELNLLLQSKRCAVFAFRRDDTQSLRHHVYDPPASWSQVESK